jgi:hypothetical protein
MRKFRAVLAKTIIAYGCVSCSFAVFGVDEIADPSPDDFAFGVDVLMNESHAFQTVDLPDHYYRHVARQDGRDLRVFNAEGVPLSFTLSSQDITESGTRTHQLPFFPIVGSTGSKLSGLALRINRSTDGTIIDISEDGKQETGTSVIAFIIDNSYSHDEKADGRLVELEFDWAKPEYGFINDIKMEKSADLKIWSPLMSDESLSRLAYEGEVIGKQLIAVNRETDKFLRLTWSDPDLFELKGIRAHYQWSQSRRELHWQDVNDLAYVDDTDEAEFERGAYRFSIKGHAPVQQLTFRFDDGNAFYRGRLYSRSGAESRWITRGDFLQYKLKMPGGVVQSKPFQLPVVRDSEWLIRFDTPASIKASSLPVIRAGWYPERLTFLAQGRAPYIIAYGNPRVSAASTDLGSLLTNLNEDQRKEILESPAMLAEPVELAGVSVLEPGAKKFPYRTVLLWLVLLGGVLIMAKMAISLFRQMDDKRP